nr:4030_t:CDS:2 [Entrophospora candida]
MRIVDILCSLLKGDTDQVEANLMKILVNQYLKTFQWNTRADKSLSAIPEKSKEVKHLVLDSEYLEKWYSKYETITQMIVLQSSQKIAEDNEMANHHKEFGEVGATEKELWTSLLRLATMNFGKVFVSWVHLKILRVYVESVLHYGLPPDFMSVIIKKIREILNTQYGKYGGELGNEYF